jgi:GAF domain-containing protein
MAIPLLAGDTLVGVLDVQADYVDRFTDIDVQIKTTLGNQIAVAVQNARAFEQIHKQRAEMEVVTAISSTIASTLDLDTLLEQVSNLTKEKFGLYHAHIYLLDAAEEHLVLAGGAGEVGRVMKERGHSIALNREHSLVASAARTHKGLIANDVSNSPEFLPNELLPDTRAEMAIPLLAGDILVGVLDVQADYVNRFTDIDVQIKTTLGNQIAVAVQNARAFDQIHKQRAEMEVVTAISSTIASTLDLDSLLEQVSNLTKEKFGLYHAQIYLLDATGEHLVLAGGAGEVGRIMKERGHSITLGNEHSLVARVARIHQGLIANDVYNSPEFLPNELLPDTRAEMAIPLLVGNTLVGVLDVQADYVDRFTQTDVQIKTTLGNQIAVAVQNARAFEQIGSQRAEMEIVTAISTTIASIFNLEMLLEQVSNLTKEKFGLYHAHIYLLDAA